MRIQNTPKPRVPAKLPDKLSGKEKIAIEWAQQQAEGLAAGRNLIVDLGDGHEYTVAGTRIGPAEKTFSALQQFFTAGVQEVQAAINAGPSLALTGATEVVKPMITGGLPYEVASNINQWYQPGLMGVSVGLSVIKFLKTYKQHQAFREIGETPPIIKTAALVANGAQIATTALGLAGALTAVAVPSLSGFATTAQGIALGGNAVAFGVNWLDYFNERSRSYMPLGDVKKQK